jgi:hypothetical protein
VKGIPHIEVFVQKLPGKVVGHIDIVGGHTGGNIHHKDNILRTLLGG